MTYCSFCVINMIILLVDLNALVYVDMKTGDFFFSERNGFIVDQSALFG